MASKILPIKIGYVKKLTIAILLLVSAVSKAQSDTSIAVDNVAKTSGLIAFWDFNKNNGKTWTSYFDPTTSNGSFPVFLKQINDTQRYTLNNWPYQESEATLEYDKTGPFGQAIRFNRGYIYGEVPREFFEETLLNIHGKQAFTMITWVKFIDERHFVAGIWDEGGWDKYAGQRQVALFSGLFNQKGVIAHISATGAASYPQSSINGAQYARLRAIDAQPFEDNTWVAMAMTYDPKNNEVRAYLNGKMTALQLADPVTEDVHGKNANIQANPFSYKQPIYSPRTFQLKFNGYDFHHELIKEHALWVDLEKNMVAYQQIGGEHQKKFRVKFDVLRKGKSLLTSPTVKDVKDDVSFSFMANSAIKKGDDVIATLLQWRENSWQQVGTTLKHTIIEGAPFTFGRALGLGSENLDSGSVIYIDGVAVFNRVLSDKELSTLSFNGKN